MKRSFIRDENLFMNSFPVNMGRWGMVGLGPEVGVTTLGTILARIASNRKKEMVQYVEIRSSWMSKPLIFDAYGMDQRFLDKPFYDFYQLVRQGEEIKHKINREEGLGWALMTRENTKEHLELTLVEKLHLLHHLSSDLMFCDLSLDMKGPDGYSEMDQLLREMSGIIAVIDPMPSKLIYAYPLLARLKGLEERGKKVYYLLNKANKGVHRRELLDFIKRRPHYEIPYYAPDMFYESQYNLQLPDRMVPLLKEMEQFVKTYEIFL